MNNQPLTASNILISGSIPSSASASTNGVAGAGSQSFNLTYEHGGQRRSRDTDGPEMFNQTSLMEREMEFEVEDNNPVNEPFPSASVEEGEEVQAKAETGSIEEYGFNLKAEIRRSKEKKLKAIEERKRDKAAATIAKAQAKEGKKNPSVFTSSQMERVFENLSSKNKERLDTFFDDEKCHSVFTLEEVINLVKAIVAAITGAFKGNKAMQNISVNFSSSVNNHKHPYHGKDADKLPGNYIQILREFFKRYNVVPPRWQSSASQDLGYSVTTARVKSKK